MWHFSKQGSIDQTYRLIQDKRYCMTAYFLALEFVSSTKKIILKRYLMFCIQTYFECICKDYIFYICSVESFCPKHTCCLDGSSQMYQANFNFQTTILYTVRHPSILLHINLLLNQGEPCYLSPPLNAKLLFTI